MFLGRANSILNEATQAQAELAMADLTRLTLLRLAMIEDFDADVTPALLTEMGSHLLNCNFKLETGASHQLVDPLEPCALDVIVAADIGQDNDDTEVHPLMVEPVFIAAPREKIGDDVEKSLRRLPMIRYANNHFMGQLITDHLGSQNSKLRHRFELDSYSAIMAMVTDGPLSRRSRGNGAGGSNIWWSLFRCRLGSWIGRSQ